MVRSPHEHGHEHRREHGPGVLSDPRWPVNDPHVVQIEATADDIDAFGHVNNVRYVAWAMDVAWSHSCALGMTFDAYRRLGVGCVVLRHDFEYRRPTLEGDVVDCATWIESNDGRLRLTRRYEMRSSKDQTVLFCGRTIFVCVDMASGKPARMPAAFRDAYAPAIRKEP